MQGAFKGWILLDEISMVGIGLLAALDQLRLHGTKIISFGDWGQLAPHPESNSFRGESIPAETFKNSRLYKTWSDCTCFELTRCRRCDHRHFDLYTSLPKDLSKAIKTSRNDTENARMQICMSRCHIENEEPFRWQNKRTLPKVRSV